MDADMRKDTEVLIVEAGPVGLTLANDLAARDISFRIVDLLMAPLGLSVRALARELGVPSNPASAP
jgi:2-polyprenyl-6-methoxyphenol hydroxylase-like FAD-dependent oxidoreductase